MNFRSVCISESQILLSSVNTILDSLKLRGRPRKINDSVASRDGAPTSHLGLDDDTEMLRPVHTGGCQLLAYLYRRVLEKHTISSLFSN